MERLRLRLYVAGLIIALLFCLAASSADRSHGFWIISVLILLGLAANWIRLAVRLPGASLRWSSLAALVLSAAIPLSSAASTNEGIAVAIAHEFVWPQIFVALFASRVLAEENNLRLAEFWRQPAVQLGPLKSQSSGSALALAVCGAFLFYLAVPFLKPSSSDPALSIVGAALEGTTSIHAAIVFLFFFVLAQIGEAWVLHWGDRAFIHKIWSAKPEGLHLGGSEVFGTAFGHVREVRLWAQALPAGAVDPGRRVASKSFAEFHGASRRFIRNLLPLLPMLGFLGTIIGLSTTLADLPGAMGPGAEAHGADFSGAISGLALKFQTTLLGLLASMICGLCLAALERRESELVAEYAHLAHASDVEDV